MVCMAVAVFVFRYSIRHPLAKPDPKPAGPGDPSKKYQAGKCIKCIGCTYSSYASKACLDCEAGLFGHEAGFGD